MRVIITLCFLSVFSLSFHSCSKSNNNTGTTDSAYMVCTVSAYAFNTVKPGSTSAVLLPSGGIEYVNINGLDSNGKAIQITLTNVTTEGNYAIGTGIVTAYYYPSGGFLGTGIPANGGSINITSLSPDIKGTFNFTTIGYTVANGTFSVQAPN